MRSSANWKDPAAYPPKSTHPRVMAWEFLRRNPKYQEDYWALSRLFQELLIDYPEALTKSKAWWALERDPRAKVFDPPKRSDESQDAWVKRVQRGSIRSVFAWYAERWGMAHRLPDPLKERLDIDWTRVAGMVTPLRTRGSQGYLEGQGDKVALGFDLSYPIRPQITAAEHTLNLWRKERAKTREPARSAASPRPNRGARLVTFLRILDAQTARASVGEIGQVLFPRTPNEYPDRNRDRMVRATLKAAIAMRDGGYVDLLMSQKAAPPASAWGRLTTTT